MRVKVRCQGLVEGIVDTIVVPYDDATTFEELLEKVRKRVQGVPGAELQEFRLGGDNGGALHLPDVVSEALFKDDTLIAMPEGHQDDLASHQEGLANEDEWRVTVEAKRPRRSSSRDADASISTSHSTSDGTDIRNRVSDRKQERSRSRGENRKYSESEDNDSIASRSRDGQGHEMPSAIRKKMTQVLSNRIANHLRSQNSKLWTPLAPMPKPEEQEVTNVHQQHERWQQSSSSWQKSSSSWDWECGDCTSEAERRIYAKDKEQQPYTKDEFIKCFGMKQGEKKWNQAMPVSTKGNDRDSSEVRIFPGDEEGKAYTKNEFIEFAGKKVGEKMWNQAVPAKSSSGCHEPQDDLERRIHPDDKDKKPYTKREFIEFAGPEKGEKMWQNAFAVAADQPSTCQDPELRVCQGDKEGKPYSKDEFIECFDEKLGNEMWNEATPLSRCNPDAGESKTHEDGKCTPDVGESTAQEDREWCTSAADNSISATDKSMVLEDSKLSNPDSSVPIPRNVENVAILDTEDGAKDDSISSASTSTPDIVEVIDLDEPVEGRPVTPGTASIVGNRLPQTQEEFWNQVIQPGGFHRFLDQHECPFNYLRMNFWKQQ
eukprot:gnl/MRDRNA2_/MRDRNA2_46148_c0_seq1.p1 gnl/MRDRNA2_/MRDRNA2_46148_c0~~gnl/MRDRNA2_/MRDRNA2_46148_c0_seq1.p1  ORF type:complete len:601 (+),score=152.95 gnl/MRDRNA2_/MRDRNA2_46148_c0_seq1:95-1897(+)